MRAVLKGKVDPERREKFIMSVMPGRSSGRHGEKREAGMDSF